MVSSYSHSIESIVYTTNDYKADVQVFSSGDLLASGSAGGSRRAAEASGKRARADSGPA